MTHWLLTELLIRSALVLAAAEILRRFPRFHSADRHRIVLAGFALLVMWPLFAALLPEIHIPLWAPTPARASVTVTQTVIGARPENSAPNFNWPLAIWFAGVLIALAPLAIGYWKVRRMAGRAIPIREESWTTDLEALCAELKIARTPKLLMLATPIVPLSFGLGRPRILLPAECREWTAVRRRSVLAHELAHIERRDIWAQLFTNVVTALWWFQPLCWMSRWTLRRESEQACDAVVLAAGVRASDYASELLKIAQNFREGQWWSSAAIMMARPSQLEDRLKAILGAPPRPKTRTPLFAALSALTALAATVSAVTVLPEEKSGLPGDSPMKRTVLSGLLASAGLSAATIGGSLFDPGGAPIPNAQATIYNPDTSAKQEMTTTADGKFVFESLPAGQYILRIEKSGYAALYREFNLQADSNVQRGLVLKQGSNSSQAAKASLDQSQAAKASLDESQANNAPVATQEPSSSEPFRVGGNVAQANLIQKVQPVYPAAAKAAGVQGTVDLRVVISKEGIPVDISVTSSPSDDLTESALDAVRQWRYRPTLLNGNPVEIVTDVIVNYTLSK